MESAVTNTRLLNQLAELQDEFERLQKERNTALADIRVAREELNCAQEVAEKESLHSRLMLKHSQREVAALQTQLQDSQAANKQLRHDTEQSAAELAAVLSSRSDSLETMQATCFETKQQLQAKQDANSKALKQLQGQNHLIQAVEHDMRLLKQEMIHVQKSVDCTKTQVKDHQTRIQGLVVKESTLIGQLQLQRKEYTKLEADNKALLQNFAAKTRDLQAAIAESDIRKCQITALNKTKESLEGTIKQMTTQQDKGLQQLQASTDLVDKLSSTCSNQIEELERLRHDMTSRQSLALERHEQHHQQMQQQKEVQAELIQEIQAHQAAQTHQVAAMTVAGSVLKQTEQGTQTDVTQPTDWQAAKAQVAPLSAPKTSLSVSCTQQQYGCGQVVHQGSPVNSRPPADPGSRTNVTNASSHACAGPALQGAAVVPANVAASYTQAATGQPMPHMQSSGLTVNAATKLQADQNTGSAAQELKANRLPALCSASMEASNTTPSACLTAKSMQSVPAIATSTASPSTAAAAMAVRLQFAMDDASQLELDTDSPIMSTSPAIQAPYACSPPFPGLKRLCCDDVAELQCCSASPIKRHKSHGNQLSSSDHAESAVISQQTVVPQQLITLGSARQHAVTPATLLSSANQADKAVIHNSSLRGLPVISPNKSSSRPPVLATPTALPATAIQDKSADFHNQLHPSTLSPATTASTKLSSSAPSTVALAAACGVLNSSVVTLKPAQPNGALFRESKVQQAQLSCIPEQAAAASLVHIEELSSIEASTDPADCTQGLMQPSGLDIDIDTDDAGKQASNPTSAILPNDDNEAVPQDTGDTSYTATNKVLYPQVKLVSEADGAREIGQPVLAKAQQPGSGGSGAKPLAKQHAGSIFSSLLGFDANSEDEDEGEDAALKPLSQGAVNTAAVSPVGNQANKHGLAAPQLQGITDVAEHDVCHSSLRAATATSAQNGTTYAVRTSKGAVQTQKAAKQACPRCAEPEYGFMPACKLCHTKYHAGCLDNLLPGPIFVCQTCQKSKAGKQRKAPAKSILSMTQVSK